MGSSLTDSSETDSSSNTDSSSVASTEKGNTGGNTSTGGTTGGKTGGGTSGGGTTGGGTSGGGTSGGGSTNPTPTTMTFEVIGFTPFAEKNYNTGLGKPVFEYIYGVQVNEGGIPTKYIQQRDVVVLKTDMDITSVESTGFITAEVTGSRTITVKAKYQYDLVEVQKSSITVNGKYKYNFNVYRAVNYNEQSGIAHVAYLYWEKKGNVCKRVYDPSLVGYTGGDQSKSITERTTYKDHIWYDDWIDMNNVTFTKTFWLLDEYQKRGYKYMQINMPAGSSVKALLFLAY